MNRGAPAVLAISALLSLPGLAAATELQVELNPRLDAAGSFEPARTFTQRAMLKTKAQLGNEMLAGKPFPWRLFLEGFAEADLARDPAERRRAENTLALQELFWEVRWEEWQLRAGRQAVRWSESWTLPSLDFWTSRRWNRLFLDPVAEQLTHSTGMLLSRSTPDFTVEAFGVLLPADTYLPRPFPETERPDGPYLGARVKGRNAGFDWSVAGATFREYHAGGASGSYAFDHAVPRLELGTYTDREAFVTIGSDLFPDLSSWTGDQWAFSLLPQLTWIRPGDSGLLQDDHQLFYVPLRVASSTHAFEVSYYRDLRDEGDQFASFLYRLSFAFGVDLSVYAQNYSGAPGSLFGTYSELTGETIYGLRLEAHEHL